MGYFVFPRGVRVKDPSTADNVETFVESDDDIDMLWQAVSNQRVAFNRNGRVLTSLFSICKKLIISPELMITQTLNGRKVSHELIDFFNDTLRYVYLHEPRKYAMYVWLELVPRYDEPVDNLKVRQSTARLNETAEMVRKSMGNTGLTWIQQWLMGDGENDGLDDLISTLILCFGKDSTVSDNDDLTNASQRYWGGSF